MKCWLTSTKKKDYLCIATVKIIYKRKKKKKVFLYMLRYEDTINWVYLDSSSLKVFIADCSLYGRCPLIFPNQKHLDKFKSGHGIFYG